jgi:hypothetical protein
MAPPPVMASASLEYLQTQLAAVAAVTRDLALLLPGPKERCAWKLRGGIVNVPLFVFRTEFGHRPSLTFSVPVDERGISLCNTAKIRH